MYIFLILIKYIDPNIKISIPNIITQNSCSFSVLNDKIIDKRFLTCKIVKTLFDG